ncbi:MAG: hypothetical protein J5662_01070, partial [Clostridia bacterium]|nr:hypothetical protein [Clostridia bacterium]
MKSCTVGADYSTLRFNGILPAEAYNKDEEKLIVSRAVYDYIEFDVYIENYDAFIHSLSYDSSGKPLNKKNTLMFNLSSRGDFDLGRQGYQWKRLETQITKDGWNHIILNLYNNSGATTMQPATSSPTGSADNRFYSLFIGEENGEMWAINNSIPQSVNDVSHTTTETAGSVFAFTNVSLTAVSVPDTDFSEYGMISQMGSDITEQNITPDSKEENKYVTYSEINEGTKLTEKFESDIDCTAGEYIEFDLFCENPKVLKDTFNYDKVDYLFTLTDKNGKTASSSFFDKISLGGWSHIRLELASFKGASGIDFGAISSYALMFEGKDLSKKFAERKQEISIANMYLTGINGIHYNLIENKTEIPLFTGIKNSVLGKNSGTLLSASENSFTVTGIESADLSAADYIAFDLHISDIDKYNSLTGSDKLYLWLSSAGGKSAESVNVQFDKYRQVGDNNWLHFFIPKADFSAQSGKINWASVNSCGIGFENPAASAGDVFDLEMGFTNVGGYAVGAPQGDLLGQITAVLSTDTHRIITDDDGFQHDISGFEPAKFASGNTFEMDVFVENSGKLNKAIESGASVYVILTNESNQTMKLELLTLLSHDGWNHIAISRDLGIYDSFQSKKLVTAASIVLNDEQNEVLLNNMTLLFSNLYFTNLTEREEGVLSGDKICDFITKPNSGYLNQSFSSAITAKSSEAVDFTDVMFVEFDFYCQDYVLIDNAIKAKDNNICLTLTDDAKVTYTAEIWPFVEKSGWNHIAVPYGNFIASRQNGTQNMKSYTLSFGGDLSNKNSAKNASWAIANVCISGLTAPELKTENTVIHTMLSKLKSGTIGNKLTFGFDQKLEESILLENARFIEFDFYVEDQKTYSEQFALNEYGKYKERYIEFILNSNNGKAYWNNWAWQIKQDGWNHIILPIHCPDTKTAWDEGDITITAFSFSCGGKALTESSLADDLIMVANVAATKLVIPEKPKNTIESFGTYIEGTCG